jgi:two-component system cell cycle response regulator
MTAGPLETILIVDDSSLSRRIMARTLESAGYEVVEAEDGVAALDRYAENPFPVVVTDIAMPRMDGLELLARLRRSEPCPEVVLLTAQRADDAAAAIQALRLGAHDYLSKEAAEGDALVLAVRRAAERRRLQDENRKLLEELRRLSLTDVVTAVGNRRAFDESLRQQVARARRTGSPLALVLLDLDLFKRVNDRYGHQAGDDVLRAFAVRLKTLARGADGVFRHGGEEFALVLGDTDLGGGSTLAERIVQATAAEPFVVSAGTVGLTCSAGVAALEADDDAGGTSLTTRADAALYRAKGEGRNCARSGPAAG